MGSKRKNQTPVVQKKGFSLDQILLVCSVIFILVGVGLLFLVAKNKNTTDQDQTTILQDEKKSTLHKYDDATIMETYKLVENLKSEDTEARIIAAVALMKRGEREEEAIPILKEVMVNSSNLNFVEVAYEEVIQYYKKSYQHDIAIKYLYEAIELPSKNGFLHRWYGFLLEELLEEEKFEEGDKVFSDCIEKFKSENFFPFHCMQQGGMIAIFTGEVKTSNQILLKNFREVLKNWRDNNEPCPSILVPLAVDTNLPGIDKLREEIIIDNDLESDVSTLISYDCSDQKYPYYIGKANFDGKVYSRTAGEYTEAPFSRMGCHSREEKKAVLYKIPNASVTGENFFISAKLEDGRCVHYVPGYPYQNSLALPRQDAFVMQDAPTIYVENAIFLHFLGNNYYHWTIECLSKIVLVLEHPFFNEMDFKFLVSPTGFAEQFVNKFGIGNMVEVYEAPKYNYQINNLYIIDWKFETNPSNISEDSLLTEAIHPEEYYVPPVSVLQTVRHKLAEAIPEDEWWEPRDYVIFLHRRKHPRTIENPLQLYQAISYICSIHGLKLRLHGFNDVPVNDQINLFSRAVAVIGIHGAGFTNMVFCKNNTAIIELPVTPHKVSVYSRMASIFNFPYYTVPTTSFYHFRSIKEFTSRMVIDTEETLYQALADLGYSYK